MENLVIKARISTTSKKQDSKFKQKDNPTKTAYLEIAPEYTQKAQAFGLTEYTSKEDGNAFYITKLPQQISIYLADVPSQAPEKMSGSVDEPNFKTPDDKYLMMNIIKGENMGNEFFRLQAISIEDSTDIELIEQQNPFA